MVGMLVALPNTQLTRRLASEGRLHPLPEMLPAGSADQCTQGLNFETLRPRREILLDYKRVLEKAYDPDAYVRRLQRLATLLDNSGRCSAPPAGDSKRMLMMHRIMTNLPEPREKFWQAFTECVKNNPRSTRYIVMMLALYLHLGPFSRYVIQQIDQKIDEIDKLSLALHERTDCPAAALTL